MEKRRSNDKTFGNALSPRTTELLGLVPPGVRYEQGTIVRDENVFNFLLGCFVDVLLVIGDERLGDGLSNRINLGDVTSAVDSNANVDGGESILAEQKDGLFQLLSQRPGLDEVERPSVDFNESVAALAVGHRRRRLLAAKHLHRLKSLFLSHD